MDVSENNGTPKSSILIGFSIINHPFGGTPIFGNTQVESTITKHSQLLVIPMTLFFPHLIRACHFFGKSWQIFGIVPSYTLTHPPQKKSDSLKVTLPETNSLPLKMDGWNTSFLLGNPIFRGFVSFREGKPFNRKPSSLA